MEKRKKLFAPARPGLSIPMPDRGNRILPVAGITIDETIPYYRRLIRDGDIVEISASRAEPATSPPGAPAGRATTRGGQSPARPSADGIHRKAKRT